MSAARDGAARDGAAQEGDARDGAARDAAAQDGAAWDAAAQGGDAWDAIIVAGGRGSRLGGVSKPALEVGGVPLLDRALDAVAGAREVVLVGGPRRDGVRWTVEDPSGSGPAAAVAAGLAALGATDAVGATAAPWVVVLAVDTPRAADAVPALLAARRDDGAWFVDADGRHQPLLAVYATRALGSRASADLAGASMRRLVGDLHMIAVRDPGDVSRDLDTWEDADYWASREWAAPEKTRNVKQSVKQSGKESRP